MKKILLLIGVVLFSITILNAQNVKKSEVFVQLFGTKYYLHTIKDGETVDAIARAYGVSIQDINMQNKALVGKMTPGTRIKIPVMGENTTPGYTQQFVYHTVERKQTMYSICKQYGVTEDDIYKYNPSTKAGLKAGTVLKIPVGNPGKPDRQDAEFVYHTAKQNETLLSLSERYSIEIDEIVKYNPSLKNGIPQGTIIRLPRIIADDKNLEDIAENQVDEIDLIKDRAKRKEDYIPCDDYHYQNSKTFKIALLLPLFINDNASISESVKSEPDKKQLIKNSERIFEFYNGVLLAIKKHQNNGEKVCLYVYDTENNFATTDRILTEPELKKMDLIIGPLYTDNVVKVARFSTENQIAMISPFAQKNEILHNNPYLYQFSPSTATSIAQTTDFFSQLSNSNIVVVHNGSASEIEMTKIYRDNLTRSYFSDKNVPDMIFKEIDIHNGGISRVEEAMNLAKNNVILIPSNDEVFITKVVNQLATIVKTNKYKVTLFGSQSWEKYVNIDVEFLQNMNFCYRSNSFIDYSKTEVKMFVSDFREFFNIEPGIYGFSGYDIADYFISKLVKHGKYFQFCDEGQENGLIYKFDFQRVNPTSGFENKSTFVLRYGNNFELEQAD
ncbi:MAG: LysM peptidoglycan-binding domain-containing protein [Bacteroidales bacterium]|nr:LysM peptidoglycan-binding domain-containing protein [Bacteroidales bacterium]